MLTSEHPRALRCSLIVQENRDRCGSFVRLRWKNTQATEGTPVARSVISGNYHKAEDGLWEGHK